MLEPLCINMQQQRNSATQICLQKTKLQNIIADIRTMDKANH